MQHTNDLQRLGLRTIHNQIRINQVESVASISKVFPEMTDGGSFGEPIHRFLDRVQDPVRGPGIVLRQIVPYVVQITGGKRG